MQSLQLQEKIESLIKSIILKHPKIENDILFLRKVFIDSVKGINKDFWKVVKKYEKTKQKLKEKEQNSNSMSNGSYELSSTRSPRQNNKSKQRQWESTKYSDYDIDLMTIILSQAKSIKSIFEQTLKLSTQQQQQSQSIKTTSIINIFNAYKDFYKSFKHKHKQYLKNFSYDEKHIHKNSTQMKQRLIDQLKRQMQKRKQLEQKLSALQTSIEKTLKHKNHQIQRLNHEIQQLKSDLLQRDKLQKISHCRSISPKDKKLSINFKEQKDNILNQLIKEKQKQVKVPISEYLSDSISSHSERHNSQQNQSNSQQQKQNTQKQRSHYQENQQESTESKQISRLPNRSSLGKFYMGSDLIKTGRINNSQIRKNNNDNYQKGDKRSRNSDNLRVQSREVKQQQTKRSQQHKMTFGNQGKLLDQKNGNKQRLKQSEKKGVDFKSLMKQMNRLKEQLSRQRQEKQSLRQKIKQSDMQYRRLEEQVNQLYKMMQNNQPKQLKKQENKKIQNQNKDQQSPGKWKVNNTTRKRTIKQNRLLKQQNKQIDNNYDECEDIEQIIQKAQKSFLHNNNNNNLLNKTTPTQINNYQISFGDVVSPNSKKKQILTNNQPNLIKLASPPKNIPLAKTQSLKSKNSLESGSNITPTKNVKHNQNIMTGQIKSPSNKQLEKNKLNVQRNQSIQQSRIQQPTLNKDISSLSIRSYSNNNLSPYKNLPPLISSRNRLENEMKAQLQQIQQYYAERIKEKQQEAQFFQDQTEKQKVKNNVLMMMLLTQAGALQEFILKEQQSLQQPEELN